MVNSRHFNKIKKICASIYVKKTKINVSIIIPLPLIFLDLVENDGFHSFLIKNQSLEQKNKINALQQTQVCYYSLRTWQGHWEKSR